MKDRWPAHDSGKRGVIQSLADRTRYDLEWRARNNANTMCGIRAEPRAMLSSVAMGARTFLNDGDVWGERRQLGCALEAAASITVPGGNSHECRVLGSFAFVRRRQLQLFGNPRTSYRSSTMPLA
jgi:hypothetical protein